MQIILKEDVANLGQSGELISVRPGYGRNYLIPQGFAALATAKNVAQVTHDKKVIELRNVKAKKVAEDAAGKLSDVTVRIERSVGEGDKLFGSVTTRDIEEALAARGHKIDKKKIQLREPIKALGEYPVDIKLGPHVTAMITVAVVAKA
ncbi:MAG: 50S ribosomal protein L9 [Myxococcales bacterium]|nr:50S ribosomal protein L9 [Myxococcales bacterium]